MLGAAIEKIDLDRLRRWPHVDASCRVIGLLRSRFSLGALALAAALVVAAVMVPAARAGSSVPVGSPVTAVAVGHPHEVHGAPPCHEHRIELGAKCCPGLVCLAAADAVLTGAVETAATPPVLVVRARASSSRAGRDVAPILRPPIATT